MVNRNWKFRIVSAIIAGLLFVGILCLVDYLFNGKFQSFNSYLFQGVFFGIFTKILFPYVAEKLGKNIKPELQENEKVEIESSANLFRGKEGVGGKIFLTNKKVIFKSHKINIQKGQIEIEYKDIIEVIERKTARLINNGIQIKTKDGKEYNFVVNEREKYIEKLNEKIK